MYTVYTEKQFEHLSHLAGGMSKHTRVDIRVGDQILRTAGDCLKWAMAVAREYEPLVEELKAQEGDDIEELEKLHDKVSQVREEVQDKDACVKRVLGYTPITHIHEQISGFMYELEGKIEELQPGTLYFPPPEEDEKIEPQQKGNFFERLLKSVFC